MSAVGLELGFFFSVFLNPEIWFFFPNLYQGFSACNLRGAFLVFQDIPSTSVSTSLILLSSRTCSWGGSVTSWVCDQLLLFHYSPPSRDWKKTTPGLVNNNIKYRARRSWEGIVAFPGRVIHKKSCCLLVLRCSSLILWPAEHHKMFSALQN